MANHAIGRSIAPANTVPSIISRRAALAALAIAPVASCASAGRTNGIFGPDASIEAAWQRRVQAYADYIALPEDNQPTVDGYGPGERELWEIIDAAEEMIRSAVAQTPHGVMIQLWCSLYHSVTGREDDEALTRADFAALDRIDSTLDWNARLALAAIRSLQAMEA